MTTQVRSARRANGSTDAPARRLFSVDEYYRLGEAGILRPGERVELVEGEIIRMSPIGSPHSASVSGFKDAFDEGLPKAATVRVQDVVRLSPRSEPRPDLAVVRRRADRYRAGHPGPMDVYLIVEVSDTTLAYDQNVKLPMYARAGIPEAWIADLHGERILAHHTPVRGRYTRVTTYGRGETLAPQAFRELTIAVDDVLGPRT